MVGTRPTRQKPHRSYTWAKVRCFSARTADDYAARPDRGANRSSWMLSGSRETRTHPFAIGWDGATGENVTPAVASRPARSGRLEAAGWLGPENIDVPPGARIDVADSKAEGAQSEVGFRPIRPQIDQVTAGLRQLDTRPSP